MSRLVDLMKFFFMYAEDVDLSWRVRGSGYRIKYVPKAAIIHYAYADVYAIKPLQYYNSIINDLYLRYRYGNVRQMIIGNCRVIKHILQKPLCVGARRNLIEKYIKHFKNMKLCKLQKQFSKKVAKFIRFNYEYHRIGAFYFHEKLADEPKISVVIINKSKKDISMLLQCLANQTYSHIKWYYSGTLLGFKSRDMVSMDLDTLIANLNTPYFSLVDENFLYYADHFETLINYMEHNRKSWGVTSYCNESVMQEKLSGAVFCTDKVKRIKQDISLAEIYNKKYENEIAQKILCINVETRKVWRH